MSGLEIGAADAAEGQIQMLAEYLAGEVGGLGEQTLSARISRLIIAGNSLGPIQQPSAGALNTESERKSVRFGASIHDIYIHNHARSAEETEPGCSIHVTSYTKLGRTSHGCLPFYSCPSAPRAIRPRGHYPTSATSSSGHVRRRFTIRILFVRI